MTLSARMLGKKYGLTAEEMNVLLKEEGFQKGDPCNYSVTEKGKKFAHYNADDNGYGGYGYKGWEWVVWDESIINELNITTKRIYEIKKKTSEQRRIRKAERNAASHNYRRNFQQPPTSSCMRKPKNTPSSNITRITLESTVKKICNFIKNIKNNKDQQY